MRTIYLIQFCFFSVFSFAQDGLEGIIVEQYYVSGANDNKGSLHSGDLPLESVTYRIYVDLKPGFRFQAAYGSPGHPLHIESTEPFYNHIESGTTHPNILPERALNNDIALLDSWLSVGSAGENHMGILRAYDDNIQDELIHFQEGYFENKSSRKELSMRERDGMKRCESIPFPTFYQIDSCLDYLGSASNGKSISTENGAWACMGKGSVGVDSLTTNCVLIAQLTTAGEISFELNLLIGAPNGTSQKYVAKNPDFGEWLHKDLIYTKESGKRNRHQKKSKTNSTKLIP